MSRKHRRKKWSPGPVKPEHNNPPVSRAVSHLPAAKAVAARDSSFDSRPASSIAGAEAAEVSRLIACGESKAAVDAAKQLHKRLGTPVSEALVVDAYLARLRSLIDRKLWLEAAELLQIVQQRYPQARDRLKEIQLRLSYRRGKLEDLLRPLNEPGLSPERRNLIETAIRQDVDDLTALARCNALPERHPLRTGAASLLQAFSAVTSRPVTDEELALPEVSHRGPLAPWKLLVRAIACFYRRDDEACERCLAAIDPESVPARLSRVLRVMKSGSSEAGLTPAEARLLAHVTGQRESVQRALEALDEAFRQKRPGPILRAIRLAVASCQADCPEIMDKLKQRITIRSALAYLSSRDVFKAMGGRARHDAHFLRLFAVALENSGDPYYLWESCQLWADFRERATTEGWFPSNGPECATLDLHMAQLLVRLESYPHVAEDFRKVLLDNEGRDEASASAGLFLLTVEQLYRRACALDPHREAYQGWLDWARKQPDWKSADAAAQAWCEVLPADVQPWLFLMESAEKRGALQKAYTFMEKAESIDGVNAEVRRARMRLLVASAIRHLKQRKEHLVEQDLQQIELLPQSREGYRPAFWAALRWACRLLRGETEQSLVCFDQISRLLEGELAALIVVTGLAETCNLSAELQEHLERWTPSKSKLGILSVAAARGLALGADMNLSCGIPRSWHEPLVQELLQHGSSFDPGQLRVLAESALASAAPKLVYAASVVGLARGGPSEARFLLLRAQSLPEFEQARRNVCLAAAAELARRQRDTRLLDEIIEARRRLGTRWDAPVDDRDFSMSSGQIDRVLKEEKQARTYPEHPLRRTVLPGDYDGMPGLCQCPECRSRRGELDEAEEFDDAENEELATLELIELLNSTPSSGDPLKDLFRAVGLNSGGNLKGRPRGILPKRPSARKHSGTPPPEQGELF
jgi:hypothetical protein